MLPEIFIIAENPQVTVSKRNSLKSLKVEKKNYRREYGVIITIELD